MKQKSLRQLPREPGVSTSYLSQIKNGKRPASQEVLSNIKDSVKQSRFDTPSSGSYNIGHGPLAQLVEQLTLNQQVTGSTPVRLSLGK